MVVLEIAGSRASSAHGRRGRENAMLSSVAMEKTGPRDRVEKR